MAIDNPDPVKLFQMAVRECKENVGKISIAEFGDQFIKGFGERRIPAKLVFEIMGVRHVSFDLNGKAGALPVDLGVMMTQREWHEAFDIVTNFGTSEHVDSNPEAQYWCFRNADYLCKLGGVMVHYIPHVDCSPHGAYHYDVEFFERLAEAARYRVVVLSKKHKLNARIRDPDQQNDHYVCAVLVKEFRGFVTPERFPKLRRHGGLRKAACL